MVKTSFIYLIVWFSLFSLGDVLINNTVVQALKSVNAGIPTSASSNVRSKSDVPERIPLEPSMR